jgi:hypothetical protein
MWLITNELLNPCNTHLVAKDFQLQSQIILMTKILEFSYNNKIPYHH